jgi:hypothetical protein
LINLKIFGPMAGFAKGGARDPRERLLHSLALFLWEPWFVDSRLLRRLRNELQAPRASASDLPRICKKRWAQFN